MSSARASTAGGAVTDRPGATDRVQDGEPRSGSSPTSVSRSLEGRSVWFVVNVDWFFLSHRAHLAVRAIEEGADVTVVCGDTGRGELIRALGARFLPLDVERHGMNPLAELRILARLLRLYRAERPDLVHHVSVKPIVWGGLAARLARLGAVVHAVSGFGYAFESSGGRVRVLRRGLEVVYRVVLRHPNSRTIFQNPDDRDLAVRRGLVPGERTVLVAGSGVDCDEFAPDPERGGAPVVVLPARLTWDKGVGDFVEAARLVRAARPATRFALVGPLDEEYRASVPRDRLEAWVADGVVEWWGERRDMPQVLAQSHVVVLPSRFEGFPKVLVEAAACERAVVASDVSGCRAAVRDGETGLLVAAASPAPLAAAITELVDDPDRRRRLARAAPRRAETELSTAVVADAHIEIYRTVLETADRRPPWWRRRSRSVPRR